MSDYRDEIAALRARIASLEGELEEARAAAEAGDSAAAGRGALRARVATLEALLLEKTREPRVPLVPLRGEAGTDRCPLCAGGTAAGRVRIHGSSHGYFVHADGDEERVLGASKEAWLCQDCGTLLIRGDFVG